MKPISSVVLASGNWTHLTKLAVLPERNRKSNLIKSESLEKYAYLKEEVQVLQFLATEVSVSSHAAKDVQLHTVLNALRKRGNACKNSTGKECGDC